MKRVALGLGLLVTSYYASFFDVRIRKIEIKPELAPDLIIYYECDNYHNYPKLLQESKDGTTMVNYGFIGRRKGLQQFRCND